MKTLRFQREFLARVPASGIVRPISRLFIYVIVFIGAVLFLLAWLLGQTVPILTKLMRHARTGDESGMALYWSTLGSFLGSLSLSCSSCNGWVSR